MAISKQDKEYIQLTAKLVAKETVEQCIDRLPCKENRKVIDDHETILHNGLMSDVGSLKKNFRRVAIGILVLIVGNYFIQFLVKTL